MKYLYKYPQTAFPYDDLVKTNRQRTRNDMEYELLDTGIFNDDRYFDVFVEYAKNTPEDILIQISVCNRGPEAASIHVLPTLWFRNTWTWWPGTPKPVLKQVAGTNGDSSHSRHARLSSADRFLYCEGDVPLLFTENETNNQRIFGDGQRRPVCQRRDQRLRRLRKGRVSSTPQQTGTKASAHYQVTVERREDGDHLAAPQRSGAWQTGRAFREAV